MYNIALAIFIITAMIILYHHILYPFILKLLIKDKKLHLATYITRKYQQSIADNNLPSISVIIPAYNEEKYVKDKILNLAILDYPAEKLNFILVCDGCSDNTEQHARETVTNLAIKNFTLISNSCNKGKIYSLNKVIATVKSDIIVLTDTSSIISIDSLLIIAANLAVEQVGVVSSKYCFLTSSVGERAYWKYQSNIKLKESTLGTALGAHGACYAFKRKLFSKIPEYIINDDFWLPVQIVLKGYKCIHDTRIVAIELESASNNMDFNRRKRISLGNIQQAIECSSLLNPKYKQAAFIFFSGKFIRAFMPVFLISCLICAIILSIKNLLFLLLSIITIGLFLNSLIYLRIQKNPKNKYIKLIHYIISSYISITLGLIDYLFKKKTTKWKKIMKD